MKASKYCPSHNGGDGAELPVSEFYPSPHQSGGYASYCKECSRAHRRAHYARVGSARNLPYRFQAIRGRAKAARLPFDLSFEQFQRIISQPCVYGGGSGKDFAISLDRKEPVKGYTVNNCVPSCPRHNLIKGNFFSFASMQRIVREFPEAEACGGAFYKKDKVGLVISSNPA